MLSNLKIANYRDYDKRSSATINLSHPFFIRINGCIIKNEAPHDGDFVTIQANEGGAFSPDWENSKLKILFILRESYILKKSFYEDGDRGGHRQNEEYATNDDLWENTTYRNLVKITYFAYHMTRESQVGIVDFKKDDVWNEACDIFRKSAAVISVNPFPGLAFKSRKTNLKLLSKWIEIPEVQALLKDKICELQPKCIYAAFDLGLISSYSHLFGWLKGRELNELVSLEGGQSILDKSVRSGGRTENITYVADDDKVIWMQGLHPSGVLSHEKMRAIAEIINVIMTSNNL